MACGHTGDWSWCQQCLQQQEAEANEFRQQREASLTARVEELEGALRTIERSALSGYVKNVASRALAGGEGGGDE